MNKLIDTSLNSNINNEEEIIIYQDEEIKIRERIAKSPMHYAINEYISDQLKSKN